MAKRQKKWQKKALLWFKNHIFPSCVKIFCWLLFKSCRITVIGLDAAKPHFIKGNTILMQWHDRVIMTPYFLGTKIPYAEFTAFVSESRDGDWLATAIESFSQGFTVRVPKDRRHATLKTFIKVLTETKRVACITPDGPKGPRHEVKPGIVMLAKTSKSNIIPFTWKASKEWSLPTWDKMAFPKPFSRIIFAFGSPISLHTMPKSSLVDYQHILKEKMNLFTHEIHTSLNKKS